MPGRLTTIKAADLLKMEFAGDFPDGVREGYLQGWRNAVYIMADLIDMGWSSDDAFELLMQYRTDVLAPLAVAGKANGDSRPDWPDDMDFPFPTAPPRGGLHGDK